MTLRLDYPACPYDPDAELVEDDRRLSLGLEPCRALVHGEDVWHLETRGRYHLVAWFDHDSLNSMFLDAFTKLHQSRAGYIWATIWRPGDEIPF